MSQHDGQLPEGEEPFPPGWKVMAAVRWGLLGLAALASVFSLGTCGVEWLRTRLFQTPASANTPQESVEFRCPMHPEVRTHAPGSCPICKMDLVGPTLSPRTQGTLEEGLRPSFGLSRHGTGGLLENAPVQVREDDLRAIGVQIAPVREEPISEELRVFGRVTVDPSHIFRIHARTSGYVEALYSTLGQRVRRGQPLLGISSDELAKLQQELVRAKRWGAEVIDPLRERLHTLGIGLPQLSRIEAKGVPEPVVVISSPQSGVLTSLNVARGDRIEPVHELMVVSDLSSVWVLAEVAEQDLHRIPLGTPAEFWLPGSGAERTFLGEVSDVSPTVNPVTRTASVRLVLTDTDPLLRPGLAGEVKLSFPSLTALTIPSEAVIDTGRHRYVMLALGDGRFEPVPVETGARSADRTAILSGLKLGDQVVAKGHFFLDAESELHGSRAATAGGSEPNR